MNNKKIFILCLVIALIFIGTYLTVFFNRNTKADGQTKEVNSVLNKNDIYEQCVAKLVNSFIEKLYSDKPFTQDDEKHYMIYAEMLSNGLAEQLKNDGGENLLKIVEQNKISLLGEYLRFSRDVLIPPLFVDEKKEIWLNMTVTPLDYNFQLFPERIDWNKQPIHSSQFMMVSVTITSGANNPYYCNLSTNDGSRHKTWFMKLHYRKENGQFNIDPISLLINGQTVICLLEFKGQRDSDYLLISQKRLENFKKWLNNNVAMYENKIE